MKRSDRTQTTRVARHLDVGVAVVLQRRAHVHEVFPDTLAPCHPSRPLGSLPSGNVSQSMPETLTTDVLAYLCARSDTRGWAMSRE
jgi:hypothetical protein